MPMLALVPRPRGDMSSLLTFFTPRTRFHLETTMTDYGTYPSGRRFAWRATWLERLLTLLRKKGFESLTAFVLERPSATLSELVAELGEGDVAPIQLTWRLVDEARSKDALRECALDLLVRCLRGVEGGWPAEASWEGQARVRIALVRWQSCLEDEAPSAILARVVVDLLDAADIPPGWLPRGVDDPRLVAVFNRHWPQER
jgi:hypothetical protein